MPCPSYPNLIAWTTVQTGRVMPLLIGPPGCGKSASIAAFAKASGAHLHALTGSEAQPTDFAIPFPHPNGEGTLKLLTGEWVAALNLVPRPMLFLDELTTLAPAQQTPMMKIIHDRRVGDTDLPKNLWIIGACNPPDCAANASELEPPLANRIQHLQWETDYEGWERAMQNGGHFDPPRFVPLPDDWEKHLPKTTGLIAAFHKHLPGRLEKYPEDRSKACGPWPSRRSWYNAGISMAALSAIDAEPLLRYRALAGCVGDDMALEYQTWESTLDLPDPEEWIAAAINHRKLYPAAALAIDVPARCDRVMAVLSSLVDRVKNFDLDPKTGKPTEARWLAGVDCFAEVAKTWVEPAIAAAAGLYMAIPSAAAVTKAPADFSQMVLEIHRNVMGAGKL
jgi:hypothetical protein